MTVNYKVGRTCEPFKPYVIADDGFLRIVRSYSEESGCEIFEVEECDSGDALGNPIWLPAPQVRASQVVGLVLDMRKRQEPTPESAEPPIDDDLELGEPADVVA